MVHRYANQLKPVLGPAMASWHHTSSDRSTPALAFLHWIPFYTPVDHLGHDYTGVWVDSYELLQLHFKQARSKGCGLKAQTIISIMLVYTCPMACAAKLSLTGL